MLKQKLLALVLVLMLGIGTLTGCSPTELSYYNLVMETKSQKVYTYTGSIELSLDQLPASMFTGEGALTEEVVGMIEQNRIEYSSKADVNQDVFQYDIAVADRASGAKSQLLTLLYINNIFYLKPEGMVEYMKQFCDSSEKQTLDKIFTDVDWISISDQDFSDMMLQDGHIGLTNNLLQRSSQQQTTWKRLFDGLINEVYKDYSGNLVSKNNNQYIFTLRGDQLIDTVEPAAVYTINNIDRLGVVLKSFINSLSPAELAEMGLAEDFKEQALQMVDLMVIAVNQDRSTYLDEIENMSADMQTELTGIVNDSELVSTLEKVNNNTYNMSTRLHLNITAGNPADKINFTLNQKNTLKSGGTVQVSVPTTGVITLKELEQRMPRQIEIDLNDGSYTQTNVLNSDSGIMAFQVVDNRTYLPLNQVADAMGEKIYWDQDAHQAYALQNGQRINITGIIVNDRTYVKVIDFEQLGFKVNWNENTRMVTIEE